MATSSRIKISGYFVFAKSPSKMSNCALVNVVLSLRCLRGGPKNNIKLAKKVLEISEKSA